MDAASLPNILDRPAVAFVQGGSGGLGSAMTRRLLSDSTIQKVYASSRSPAGSDALLELRRQFPERLELLSLDVSNEESIEAAARAVSDAGHGLDIVFNCSGVLHSEAMQPEKRLSQIDRAALLASFEINAVGPIVVLKHLVGLMPRRERSLIVNLSARVGSIADNRLGGWYGYRASKSALNMLTRCLALELKRTHPGCLCVAMHPGTVDTELSRPFASGARPFTPSRAADQIFDVVRGLSSEESGGFFAWDGSAIPW